jgi:hypothetical protein
LNNRWVKRSDRSLFLWLRFIVTPL